MTDILDKIHARCTVIAELVLRMQPMYAAPETTDYQRRHIATIVGAGLWYIPNRPLWTGLISRGAVESFHPSSGVLKPKLTQDHQYPRKIAAERLLKHNWAAEANPASELTAMYTETFGRFNYVTPSENRTLMPYQRSQQFVTPQLAYSKAGIDLTTVDLSQLKQIKARHALIIESVLQNCA